MLTCHNCIRRCLQTVIGDSAVLSISSPIRNHIATNYSRHKYTRSYTVASSHRKLPQSSSPPSSNYAKALERSAKIRTDAQKKWLDSRGTRPAHKKDLDQNFVIRKHLQYLKDPLKLAEYVRKSLRSSRDDDFEETLEVVRAASKDTECIVSWNHLIEWQLSKGRMNAAIKTYNEMKKRAQTPDARTYTIIFTGCSEHPQPGYALEKVMAIYQSMLTEKSLVKPNTIHMNAILKMCSRAQNIQALFAIVEQMPYKGISQPNNLTYTTIFNALRIHALTELRSDLTPMQKRKNLQKTLLDARILWAEDVSARWRKGDMWIDEELVCSMGRLLLLGQDKDCDDVLSLVEQTMNIPRQVPRLKAPPRPVVEPKGQGRISGDGNHTEQSISSSTDFEDTTDQNGEPVDGRDSQEATSTESELRDAASKDIELVDQFNSGAPATSSLHGVYSKPGPNTLSLILEACLLLRMKDAASRYWDTLIKAGVRPDGPNYHAMLRILRYARASSETVELLLTMPKQFMEHKTFRIAMSTCERDRNNHHAFSNSGKILDIMQNTRDVPDIPSLTSYLQIAISATPHNSKTSSSGENAPSKLSRGRQILRALERLNPSFLNLRSLLAYGGPSDTSAFKSPRPRREFLDELLGLTRRMIRATDLLMNNALVPREMYAELMQRRSKLTAYVTRHKHHFGGRNVVGASTHSEPLDIDALQEPEEPQGPATTARENQIKKVAAQDGNAAKELS